MEPISCRPRQTWDETRGWHRCKTTRMTQRMVQEPIHTHTVRVLYTTFSPTHRDWTPSSSPPTFSQHRVSYISALFVSHVCTWLSLPVASPGVRVVLNILLHWAEHRGIPVPGIWLWETERRGRRGQSGKQSGGRNRGLSKSGGNFFFF